MVPFKSTNVIQRLENTDFFVDLILLYFADKQARVPGKPISANRGLNLANRGIHFVSRLDSVPESMINLNLGINYALILTHLPRSIKSLIGEKSL